MPRNDRQAHALIADSAERRRANYAVNVAPQAGGLSVSTIIRITVIGSIALGLVLRFAL